MANLSFNPFPVGDARHQAFETGFEMGYNVGFYDGHFVATGDADAPPDNDVFDAKYESAKYKESEA